MPPTVLRFALPLPQPGLFDYVPNAGAGVDDAVGHRVRVPLGNRELIGIVAAVGAADGAVKRLRPILQWLDPQPIFHGELLDSLRRAARYYHAPLGELFATALPGLLRNGAPMPATGLPAWCVSPAGRAAAASLRPDAMPRRLLNALLAGPLSEQQLSTALPGWRPAARSLQRRGLLNPTEVFATAAQPGSTAGPLLNAEQHAAVAAIDGVRGSFTPFLLDGVTGSGKTEVYLAAIRQCIADGRQALVLVPEIGLTPQMLRRFRQRLGVEVWSLHSGLGDRERARSWTALWRGEGRVLLGTRSAVFCPLPDAGLIIVDEEHDASFKQQEGVRYSARDLALLRGQALQVPVVLGSATPSLESLAAARGGRYRHLRLSQRAGVARAPTVTVVDVRRRALEDGLSAELRQGIGQCLEHGGQVLVFRNRRGYAPVLLCHDCGWTSQCSACDAAMTVHARGRRLVCHHCGQRRPAPSACPDCGGLGLQAQGVGTERLEDALGAAFPDVPCVRVDRETTRGRDGLDALLTRLGDRPGILVGTQMLAKGHDLPGLGLVAVVGVDEGLHSADFRAGERLAQLLVQVSGRAGRAERAGRVLLQTHHPEHPLLTTLLAGGYAAIADAQLDERQAAGFPPFAHLALLRADADQEALPRRFLDAALTLAQSGSAAGVELSGPLPAPMLRRAGRVRWQLLLSAMHRPALHGLLSRWVPSLYGLRDARRVRWSIDVDPYDLY